MIKLIETNFQGKQLVQVHDKWQIREKAPYRPGRSPFWMIIHLGDEAKVMKIWRQKYRAQN